VDKEEQELIEKGLLVEFDFKPYTPVNDIMNLKDSHDGLDQSSYDTMQI
jgi:hypothetical protein